MQRAELEIMKNAPRVAKRRLHCFYSHYDEAGCGRLPIFKGALRFRGS
jgi:hypothetical protein